MWMVLIFIVSDVPDEPPPTSDDRMSIPRWGGPGSAGILTCPPADAVQPFDCVIYVVNALLQIYSSF